MNPKELLVNIIMVVALLLVIRYPGYFKDWGIGKGGRKPYEENSPAYFYVRVGAIFALCLVAAFDSFLLLRFMGADTILANLVNLLTNEPQTPMLENKMVSSFVTVSLINCFWGLWYIRLWWKKKRDYSVLVKMVLIFSFTFCLLTPVIMKVSSFWQQFCMVINAIIFVGVMLTRRIEK